MTGKNRNIFKSKGGKKAGKAGRDDAEAVEVGHLLPPPVRERIIKEAEAQGVTPSEILSRMVSEELARREADAEAKLRNAPPFERFMRMVSEERARRKREGMKEILFDSICAEVIKTFPAPELAELLEKVLAIGFKDSKSFSELVSKELMRRDEEEVEWEDFPVTVDNARLENLEQAALMVETLLRLAAYSKPESRDMLFMDESPVLRMMLEAGERLAMAREDVRLKKRKAREKRQAA